MDFRAGTRIGAYVLDSYVGGGSFGAVWRAHRESDGELVAIKLLTGALASDVSSTRAEVEVLAAAAAGKSRHVVKVLDGGQDPLPYIVMEFVEGKDLLTLLREKERLSAGETIEAGLAIADALAALDQVGIIHRDIKPANVMIDSDGVIKLADFGIAKIVGYDTATMAGQAAMTMAYAAPEIWNEDGEFGKPSHRSDLYAMGVVLYQCLAGFTPFRGNYGALYKAHTEQVADLTALPDETPPSLRAMIRRCLEKHQQDRPADADECIKVLNRAQAELAASIGDATMREPSRFGPWIKGAPHESLAWAWHCRHETSGENATLELHFSDRLEYGAILRKAVTDNASLTPFGAERLIESNRLLLRPTEIWWRPPAGEFQFWVAREDAPVSAAASLSHDSLASAVDVLIDLLEAAEAQGLKLDLHGGNLVLQESGRIYLRRPGIVQATDDPRRVALSVLATQPLDPGLRAMVYEAASLPELSARLAESGNGATVIVDRVPSVPAQDPTTVLRRPVASPPEAASHSQPLDLPAVPRPEPQPKAAAPPPYAPPARTARTKRTPLPVILGAAGALVVAVVVAIVLLGGGDDNKSAGDQPVEGAVHAVDKPSGTTTSKTGAQVSPPVVARPQGREYVDDTILLQAQDSTCSDGNAGCRTIFAVGPYRFKGNTLRIDFTLQVITPAGKGIQWKNDKQADADLTAAGSAGVQLEGKSGANWHITSAGGVANEDHAFLGAGRYTGYWEFVFDEAPGSTLTFNYPDFEEYITVPVPE